MNHFPTFPIHLTSIALFGITLLLGLIGGEIARRIRFLPKISGYIIIGFLLGPNVLNIINPSLLDSAHIFINISLGIILFNLGRCLDFTWLREDRGLLYSSIAESGLTFTLTLLFSYFVVGFSWLSSALAACFMISTSPAVVLMVANDLSSEGPVTRRTLTLTSLNNFFALTLFTLLLPLTQSAHKTLPVLLHSSYLIAASLITALIMFALIQLLALFLRKEKESQFILFIAALVFTIGITQVIHIPVALTLFILGVATRNLDKKHVLMEINFGWSTQLFFILLFVASGTYLHLEGLRLAAVTVLCFIVIRAFAKTLGIGLFSRKSRLTKAQVLSISLALTPMAGLAISMSNVLNDFNPELNSQISTIIVAMVGILEILGPIATQLAFIKSRETLSDRLQ